MRSVFLTAIAALSIAASADVAQAQGLAITNYQLVTQQNITPTKANMTYRADLVNQGPALSAVVATVTGLDPFSVRVILGQDTLNFSSVPANSQVTSNNTFTIQIDPTTPFDFNSKLQWTFSSTMGGPVANAGLNQTAPVGSLVTLNGSNSTNPSGAPLTYSWAFLSLPQGSSAYLAHSSSVMPTFVVDVPGNYVVTLTVSDGKSSSSANVTISTGPPAPVAKAGPDQTVALGATVVLNGNQSTSGSGNPLTYAWTLNSAPAGSTAVLSGGTTVSPTFVADKSGTYLVQLIVNDGAASSAPSTVKITTRQVKPVANAGSNQLVHVNDVVTLNGAGSTDANGLPLTYQWSLISRPPGSAAALSNPAAVNPTFTADQSGTYVAQLIVNNGVLSSDPATVTITTNTLAPIANAGPNQTVTVGSQVTLNGSGTDPQNLSLVFQWTLTSKPAGSAAVLSSVVIPNPTFVADVAGTYVAQLVVSNGSLSSSPSTVTISTGCSQPTANAGPAQNVNTGATVTLSGSGSGDACHDPLTYSWSFTTRPAGSAAALAGATTVSPTFVADVAGTYVVQLIVNNGLTNSNPATVTITAATSTPAADIILPANLTIQPGDQADFTVTLAKPAGPGGVFISLSSSDTSIVSLRTSNIIIPEGGSSSNQPKVNGQNVGSAVITATASGLRTASQTVQVTNGQILKFQPANVTFTSNAVQNLVLTLSAPAPAALVINLTSSNPAVATVSSTVTFFPGTMTANVAVNPLSGGQTTIHASALPNIADTTAIVTVQGGTLSIGVPAAVSLGLGQSAAFAVTLSQAAPASGLTVNLSSSDPAKVTVPVSVFIAAGATTPAKQPQVTGVGIGSANITASGAGYVSGTGAVTVTGTISFSPASLTMAPGTQNITLNLSGSTAAPLTINLSSSDTSRVTVPSAVTIAAGASSVTVPVTGIAQGGPVTITASAAGVNNTTASVTVSQPGGIGVPATASVGLGQSTAFAVTLPSAAPAGGVTVNLSSSDTSKVTIPASVFIPAGSLTPATQPQVTGAGIGSATITASASGYSNGTGTVNVPAPTLSFSGSPLSVTTGSTGNLTLNLSGGVAPAGGLTVNLSSGNTAVATVPATVSFAAGATSATVTVTGVAAGGPVTITASATGIASATATVNVTNQASIAVGALSVNLGQTGNLQITLSQPAPAGGLTVNLLSSDTTKVTVPAAINIAAGTTGTAIVTAVGIGSATITASAAGFVSGTGTVTVPAPAMSFSAATLTLTAGSTGNLTLNLSGGVAPAGGLTVNLNSGNTGVATVPATVTFAAGAASAAVTVNAVAATPGVIITASAPGIQSVTVTVIVTSQPAISVAPVTVGLGQTANLQVTISPAQGSNVTINLTSSDSTKVSVSPASITIAAGATTGQAQVTGAGIGSATIAASGTGLVSGSATVTVTPPTLSFTPPTLSINLPAPGTGTLTLNLTGGQAPAGGLTVNLTSSDLTKATVPGTVNFAAGATSASVTVTGVAAGSATITASSAGISPVTASVAVVAGSIAINVPATVGVAVGQSATFAVTLAQAAPAGGVTVNLVSSNTSAVTISPTAISIAAGATAPAAQPQVTGVASGSATITASGTNLTSASSTVTVTPPQLTLSFAGDVTVNAGATAQVTLNLKGGVAPAGGLTVNVITNPSSIATVPAGSANFLAGSNSTIVTVLGGAQGTALMTANGPGIPATTANITVLPPISPLLQPILVPSVSVGKNLQTSITLSLLTMTACQPGDRLPQGQICSAAGPGGALVIVSTSTGLPVLFPVQAPNAVLMTVISSDPAKLLVGLRGVCPGVAVPTQTTVCGAQQVVSTIPANLSTTSVFLQGLASSGTATITVSAPGYPSGMATITLTPGGFLLTGPNGVSSINTFTGAPSTQMTVSSARLDSSLNFAEYQQLRSGYNDPINGPFDDAQGTTTCNQLFTLPADIQTCIQMAKYAFNNLSGVFSTSVTISSSSPGIGGVLSAVPFAGGDSSKNGFFVPQSQGVTTLTAVAPASLFSTPASGASVIATVGQPQTTCGTVTVGQNLEAITSCTLQGGTPSAGLAVTISSSDSARLLLSPATQGSTCSAAGTQILNISTVNAAQGGTNIVVPGFCVYGLGSSGTASYTVNVQGYAPATGIVNLAPSGFVIAGPSGIGSPFDVFGSLTTITVYSALLDANLNYVAQQALAVGLSVNVNLTSSNAAVGTLSPASLTFTGGQISNATTFTSGTGGANCARAPGDLRPPTPCTVLSTVAPAGFSTPNPASSTVTAYVAVQSLSLSCGDPASPVVVGQNLQIGCTVSVPPGNPAPAGGISVNLTSNDNTKLLLSNNPSAVGFTSIPVTIPGGGTQSSTFYIQGLTSVGVPTYTASASGFPNRVGKITLAPSGIVIAGPNGLGAGFFTASSPVSISVYTAALNTDPAGCPVLLGAPCLLSTQPLRGGIASLAVSLQSSNTSIGTISSPVTIAAGGSGTASATFTPVASGQTDITVVTPANYTTSTNDVKLTATKP